MIPGAILSAIGLLVGGLCFTFSVGPHEPKTPGMYRGDWMFLAGAAVVAVQGVALALS